MVKLLLSLVAIILLGYSLIFNRVDIAIMGAIIFLLGQLYSLYDTYSMSKKYAAGEEVENISKNHTYQNRISNFFDGAIVILGLLIMVMSKELMLAGALIWLGEIVIYFVVGIIIENVTSIPLRFGYGGWQVDRRKHRKK
jgi:Ca2+/Na+ antiporter